MKYKRIWYLFEESYNYRILAFHSKAERSAYCLDKEDYYRRNKFHHCNLSELEAIKLAPELISYHPGHAKYTYLVTNVDGKWNIIGV